MRIIKSGEENIIMINGEYFIANAITTKMLELYFADYNIPQISEVLGIPVREVQKGYDEISKLIESEDYYEEELGLDEPLKFQWKITNRCNLRCKHCYEGEKNKEQMTEEEIADVFEKLIKSNVLSLTITGGEALLIKNLATYVSKCLREKMYVKIFTNGLLLDKFIDQLYQDIDLNYLSIEVSIDGTQEVHDYIRGQGNFNKAIENIKYAIAKGITIITNTVVSKANKDSIISMMKNLHHIGVNSIQISNLMMAGWARENSDDLYLGKGELKEFYENLAKSVDFDFCYADITSNEVFASHGKSVFQYGMNTWKCCAGIGRLTIDYNGNVLICPSLENYVIGNIKQESIREIWGNPLRNEYVKKLRAKNQNRKVCFIYDENAIS